MTEAINQPIEVLVAYKTGARAVPTAMSWQGRLYRFNKLGFIHPQREGRKLLHIFTVSDGAMTYRLEFDTESLNWKLTEVSDGLPS